jgi:alginate O-acetyltransferase complex protein AlgI
VSFDSFEFLLFAAVFFSFWPVARKESKARWAYLSVASLFFYAWAEPIYMPLLVMNAVVDFRIAKWIAAAPDKQKKKHILWLSIAFNIGVLACFKYLDWFSANVNWLLDLAGVAARIPYLHLTLPLGISFYTFCSMSYTIDVYRGRIKPTESLLHFMALIALFPHLVAGPIVRAGHMLPQLESWQPVTPTKFWNGLRLIVYGFFKKLVIADQIAAAVDAAFRAQEISGDSLMWWAVMSMFMAQIYCDFSGYSDIARGLAKWLGYDFPLNFNHPFFAPSSSKFWLRWHMSLFSWLRDYIFYPLSGKRPSNLRINLAMSATMILSGIWHGAAWTFVIWGFLNAVYLWVERDTKWPERIQKLPAGPWLSGIITFFLLMQTAVYFRAHDLAQAVAIHKVMLSFNLGGLVELVKKYPFELAAVAFVLVRSASFFLERPKGFERWRLRTRYYTEPVEIAVLITACVFLRGPGNAFIYFAF